MHVHATMAGIHTEGGWVALARHTTEMRKQRMPQNVAAPAASPTIPYMSIFRSVPWTTLKKSRAGIFSRRGGACGIGVARSAGLSALSLSPLPFRCCSAENVSIRLKICTQKSYSDGTDRNTLASNSAGLTDLTTSPNSSMVYVAIASCRRSTISMFVSNRVEERRARNPPTTSRRIPVNANAFMAVRRWVELLSMEKERVPAWTPARNVA